MDKIQIYHLVMSVIGVGTTFISTGMKMQQTKEWYHVLTPIVVVLLSVPTFGRIFNWW